nr:MAG TPA: hypothetical protein [Caudoviricetes sp.]
MQSKVRPLMRERFSKTMALAAKVTVKTVDLWNSNLAEHDDTAQALVDFYNEAAPDYDDGDLRSCTIYYGFVKGLSYIIEELMSEGTVEFLDGGFSVDTTSAEDLAEELSDLLKVMESGRLDCLAFILEDCKKYSDD